MTKKKSTEKTTKRSAAKPAAGLPRRVVLVVFAQQNSFTIEEWDSYLAKRGFQLEEIMTPDAWERRNKLSENKNATEKTFR
jgi:hypothetical protein